MRLKPLKSGRAWVTIKTFLKERFFSLLGGDFIPFLYPWVPGGVPGIPGGSPQGSQRGSQGPWASRPMGLKDLGPGALGLRGPGPQGPGAQGPRPQKKNLKGATAAAADPLKTAKNHFLAIFYNFRIFSKICFLRYLRAPGALGWF